MDQPMSKKVCAHGQQWVAQADDQQSEEPKEEGVLEFSVHGANGGSKAAMVLE